MSAPVFHVDDGVVFVRGGREHIGAVTRVGDGVGRWIDVS